MKNLKYRNVTYVAFLLLIISICSCDKKTNKELIVGLWEKSSIDFYDKSITDDEEKEFIQKLNENMALNIVRWSFEENNRFLLLDENGRQLEKEDKLKYKIINSKDFINYPYFKEEKENGNLIAIIGVEDDGELYNGTNIIGPFEIISLSEEKLSLRYLHEELMRKNNNLKDNNMIVNFIRINEIE